MIFHEFMPDIMDFGHFSMEDTILEIMSEEYREKCHEKYREFMEIFSEFRILYCEFLYEMHSCSPARGRSMSDGSHPCCRC